MIHVKQPHLLPISPSLLLPISPPPHLPSSPSTPSSLLPLSPPPHLSSSPLFLFPPPYSFTYPTDLSNVFRKREEGEGGGKGEGRRGRGEGRGVKGEILTPSDSPSISKCLSKSSPTLTLLIASKCILNEVTIIK